MFGLRLSPAPLLALVVIVLCAVVVWIAYQETGELTAARQPPLVKASTAPLKRSPEDPGGSAVAELGGVGDLLRDQPAEAEERLLPQAEQPVTPAYDDGGRDEEAEGGDIDARAALEALVAEVRSEQTVGGTSAATSTGSPAVDPVAPVRPETAEPDNDDAANEAQTRTDTETRDDSGVPDDTGAEQEETESGDGASSDVAGVQPEIDIEADGRFRVQLAAVREEADARRAWTVLQEQFGPAIRGLRPFFERAETDNGTFYRIQVGPFGETAEADQLCVELKKQNASCFVVSR